jgi:murein DD-endopeptidase MepM/ murein hydrolase activator NlpD
VRRSGLAWRGVLGVVMAAVVTALLAAPAGLSAEVRLEGTYTQGGLVFGRVAPGSTVTLDGEAVRVSPGGDFVIGFTRDAPASAVLDVREPGAPADRRDLAVTPREYDIQRIDGLPPKQVTPPEDVLARIRADNAAVRAARAIDTPEPLFLSGFIWPAKGRISGVYGSQRILNGEPRQPHYGIDVAAPVGTPVVAPADGIVTLATDLYFSGKTLMLDHGHGLGSAFLHMDRIDVEVGARVRQGDPVGTIGATGRVTGPHLDWRMHWFERRIDPGLLMGPMGE